MGLTKAIKGAVGGVFADQWRDYFYCEALEADVLVAKGHKKTSSRSSNTKGEDNIISDGSIVAISDGQCMIIVDQGRVADICAEPGEYTYDVSTEPSLLYGSLSKSIPGVFKNIGRRISFGGQAPKDQRIYFVNTKEITGNKYGTPSPVPFRVVDKNIGLDIDIDIRCFGEYSYRITNPILFYTNVCGNVSGTYNRSQIDGQLKTELLTALQPAFAKISDMGIRYSALPGHTTEIADALNDVMSQKWGELRGVEIVSFGVSSVKTSEENEKMIRELQRNAVFRNPGMAGAHLVGAQAAAMQCAAANENGAAMAFMGMNMAGMAGGMNTQDLFRMAQQQPAAAPAPEPAPAPAVAPAPAPAEAAAGSWTCSCGHVSTGKFCTDCGAKKPENSGTWVCKSCGSQNKGKFCMECGAKKPAAEPLYRCDKCGWEPADPKKPPRFCPECGDPFGDEDQI